MKTNRVVSDPAVMMGKPVIADTRFPVELILENLAFLLADFKRVP